MAFRCQDIGNLAAWSDRFAGIVSDTTLSTMGYAGLSAVGEWRRVLRPGGVAIVRDYAPQAPARTPDEEIADRVWRLYKAVSVLRGESYYEELPAAFWSSWLAELGFTIRDLILDEDRGLRNVESLERSGCPPHCLRTEYGTRSSRAC